MRDYMPESVIDFQTFKKLLKKRRKVEAQLLSISQERPVQEGTHESAPAPARAGKQSKARGTPKLSKRGGKAGQSKALNDCSTAAAARGGNKQGGTGAALRRSRADVLAERERLVCMQQETAAALAAYQAKLEQAEECLEKLNEEKHDLVIKLKQALQEGPMKRQASVLPPASASLVSPVAHAAHDNSVPAEPEEPLRSTMHRAHGDPPWGPPIGGLSLHRLQSATDQSLLQASQPLRGLPPSAEPSRAATLVPAEHSPVSSPEKQQRARGQGVTREPFGSGGDCTSSDEGELIEEGEVAGSPRGVRQAMNHRPSDSSVPGGQNWLPPHLQPSSGHWPPEPSSPSHLPPHIKPQNPGPGRGPIGAGRGGPGRWPSRGGWGHSHGPADRRGAGRMV